MMDKTFSKATIKLTICLNKKSSAPFSLMFITYITFQSCMFVKHFLFNNDDNNCKGRPANLTAKIMLLYSIQQHHEIKRLCL